MSDRTHIEWTDATWSPVTGCTKVSAGCEHCYIERTPPFRMNGRKFDQPGIGGTTGVQLHPDRLWKPVTWRKPRKVFVCSMADLFHDDVPDEYIAKVFAVMARTPQHTFQVLTKRHARMRSLLSSQNFENEAMFELRYPLSMTSQSGPLPSWPLPNVWLGVSAEDQQRADLRIPALLETPAAVRWVSAEPLLGAINFRPWFWSADRDEVLPGLDWLVVGGESGPGARPMHPQWARGIRDQCEEAGVPFLFKQWGEYGYLDDLPADTWMSVDVKWNPVWAHFPDGMVRVGKRAAGRVIDGQTHDEYPAARS